MLSLNSITQEMQESPTPTGTNFYNELEHHNVIFSAGWWRFLSKKKKFTLNLGIQPDIPPKQSKPLRESGSSKVHGNFVKIGSRSNFLILIFLINEARHCNVEGSSFLRNSHLLLVILHVNCLTGGFLFRFYYHNGFVLRILGTSSYETKRVFFIIYFTIL